MMNPALKEIEKNFQFFQGFVGSLLEQHYGKFALLHDANVVQIFDEPIEAFKEGHSRFTDGNFSVQEVTDKPLDLGFFSHANIEGASH